MSLRLLKLDFVNKKGQLFTFDGVFALAFCLLFILVFNLFESRDKNINNDLIKIQKINDLLITSQHLKVTNLEVLERNYLLLFPKNCGYIKIDQQKKEINCTNNKKTKLLSNSIKYINNSKHIVYIEIGIY